MKNKKLQEDCPLLLRRKLAMRQKGGENTQIASKELSTIDDMELKEVRK